MTTVMPKPLILYFRFVMAWIFLYAASAQVFALARLLSGFLNRTKTFQASSPFLQLRLWHRSPPSSSSTATDRSFVAYGSDGAHGAAFGIFLIIIYWFAHMDWPFIENTNNLVIDYHLVYAGVLATLIVTRAGHVFASMLGAEPQLCEAASCAQTAGGLTSGRSTNAKGPVHWAFCSLMAFSGLREYQCPLSGGKADMP